MRARAEISWALAGVLLLAGAVSAQDNEAEASDGPTEEVEEIIVVTASRTEQALNEAPAAITVLDASAIEEIPADDYGDLMRNIPGLNVSQTSARDLNMTSRGSTNTLSTSQLVLLDGRSLYLDFFGFVMWDFLPVNTREIKQIEAVRGPGSAVWGANAMTGVVNLITKRPKEMVGTDVLIGGGELDTLYGSVSHAGVRGDMGFKVSASYYEQEPFDRPTGLVPGSTPPTSYPDFENQGTEQPKFDFKLDKDIDDSSFWTAAAGYSATDGIIHTGIGPFDIDKDSHLAFGKFNYNRLALNVQFFANFLDADSINLLTLGTDGQPLGFAFSTETYSLDASNSSALGDYQLLTYGATARKSEFDLEIAPNSEDRDEWGVFVQDEILLGSDWRWVIGGRYDEIDPLDSGVFTPRTSILYTPAWRHTFRVSYNEAFRTPSAILNYLDVTILTDLGGGLFLPGDAVGNVDLVEEELTAYEVGYVGTFNNGLTLTFAAYENETKNSMDFFVQNTYGPTNPPLGLVPSFLLPCFFIPPGSNPACPLGGLGGVVPSDFSYRNIGETTDRGVELSLNQRIGTSWSWYFNASWQDEPDFSSDVDAASQNLPPEYRANFGLSWDGGNWFWNANANYQDEAFWADVLNVRGYTDSFTQLNASVGMRFNDEKVIVQVTGSNLTDEEILQHIFGDIISRKVTGQVSFRF